MSEPIKLPDMSFDLYSGIRDIDQFNGVQEYARLAVEQNTEALRKRVAKLETIVQSVATRVPHLLAGGNACLCSWCYDIAKARAALKETTK